MTPQHRDPRSKAQIDLSRRYTRSSRTFHRSSTVNARCRGGSSDLHLPRIAPDHLPNGKQYQDRAIDDPVLVADHEAIAECKIEPLQNPDRSQGDHRKTEQCAYDSHADVE